jgi:hypothetical protein
MEKLRNDSTRAQVDHTKNLKQLVILIMYNENSQASP